MLDFSFYSPTRLIFGKGVVEKLPEVMAPLGKRILLTYGGGSIKRSGLYDKVKTLLKDFDITELGGIEPNPKYNPIETTEEAIQLILSCSTLTVDDATVIVTYWKQGHTLPIQAFFPVKSLLDMVGKVVRGEWTIRGNKLVIEREITTNDLF